MIDFSFRGFSDTILAVSDFTLIYIDIKRKEYQYGYLSNQNLFVFAAKKPESEEASVLFWDLNNSEKLFLDIKNF